MSFEAHQRGAGDESHRRWRIWILYPPVLLGVGGKRKPEGDHADNDGHFATEREHSVAHGVRIGSLNVTFSNVQLRSLVRLFKRMLVLLYAS